MTLSKMDCFAMTDIGRHRAENEDHYLIADLVKAVRIQSTSLSYDAHAEVTGQSHAKLLLVADGMGGHAAGRRASTVAVDEAIRFMVDRMRWVAIHRLPNEEPFEALSDELKRIAKHCHRRILNEAEWDSEKRGMGATLTAAIVDWPRLHVVHVGDSRCYVSRGRSLKRLTVDHTVAQAYADAGQMPASSIASSPLRNTLWNVLGQPGSQVEPDVRHLGLEIGDCLMLCTDGLNNHVADGRIQQVLSNPWAARQKCERLIALANEDGGRDNITVAVANFLDHGDTPAEFAEDVAADGSSHDTVEIPTDQVQVVVDDRPEGPRRDATTDSPRATSPGRLNGVKTDE